MTRLLGLVCVSWCLITQAADQLVEVEDALRQNDTARAALKADIERGSKNARVLDAALTRLGQDIKAAQETLAEARMTVDETEHVLLTRQAAVATAESQLKTLQGLYRNELRVFYLTGLPLTTQPPPPSEGHVAAYLPFVLDARQQRAEAIRAQTETLREAQNRQASAVESAKRALQRAEDAEQALRKTRQEQTALLSQIRRDVSTQQARIRALEADQNRLQALIEELRAIPTGSALAPFKGRLSWPTDGLISHRYGTARADGFGTWQGLVISARDNTQVRAVQGGQVAYAGYLLGYGLVVVLGHADGYATIYGHNQQLLVKTGETIRSGAPIAIAGNTGSLETTGVYFALARQGRPENPEPWLQ